MSKTWICLAILYLSQIAYCCFSLDFIEALSSYTLSYDRNINVLYDKSQTRFNLHLTAKKLGKANHLTKFSELNDSLTCPNFDQDPALLCTVFENSLEQFLMMVDHCNLATKQPAVILYNEVKSINNLLKTVLQSTRINQIVYQFHMTTGELFEEYSINHQKTRNTLAFFRNQKFEPTAVGRIAFEKRRNNFHGLEVVAMTAIDVRATYFKEGYKKRASFHENNQTFDVTQEVYGPYQNYFEQLASAFNFTYKIYKRNDGIWFGQLENGSATGMVGNVANGNAEMIASSVVIAPTRSKFVDYLPVMSQEKNSVMISIQNLQTDKDAFSRWTTFFKPFSVNLWIVLIIVAIVWALWLHLTNLTLNKNSNRTSILDWLWVAITANFGRQPMYLPRKHSRLAMFTCLIVGNVIWIGYRAYLISALSVQRPKEYPFTSLEELANSNYK